MIACKKRVKERSVNSEIVLKKVGVGGDGSVTKGSSLRVGVVESSSLVSNILSNNKDIHLEGSNVIVLVIGYSDNWSSIDNLKLKHLPVIGVRTTTVTRCSNPLNEVTDTQSRRPESKFVWTQTEEICKLGIISQNALNSAQHLQIICTLCYQQQRVCQVNYSRIRT